MPSDQIYEDLSVIIHRAGAVFRIIAILVVLIVSYYWKVQIVDHRTFSSLAEANKTRNKVLSAPRGIIRDRGGVILADNKASFKISLIRENLKDSLLSISELLGVPLNDLKARIEKYKNVPAFEPIVVKDNLESKDIAPIESRRKEHPELQVEAEPKRIYPNGTLAAHILGYLQERTPEEIKSNPDRGLRLGDMGGKTGIEMQYDDLLTGIPGTSVETVDSLGRIMYVDELASKDPVQGRELKLTLDSKLQHKAESLLEGKEGAIVALDAETGGILAMASYPTFDPNQFITRFTPDEWLKIINDPASPLENRAIRGLYAPGSIFKLVMALGGLEFGYVTEQTTTYCNGSTEIYGIPFKCWFQPGHGAMNLANAIKNSCNIYFYNLGRLMGIDRIAQAADLMGLGRKTGVDIPGEKDGLVPSTEWKKMALNTVWYPGETISVSIGQGQLQVTPLQLAALTAMVANRGGRVTPHLLLEAKDKEPASRGGSGHGAPPPFKPSTFESVIEGMWRSVNNEGTGQSAMIPGMNVCGKTGSTQLVSRERAERLAKAGKPIKTHSWFSGFAPRENPRIVVTVLVEYGGGGGATAAPLAGQIFGQYRAVENAPLSQTKEK